jgi:hypothetical protein
MPSFERLEAPSPADFFFLPLDVTAAVTPHQWVGGAPGLNWLLIGFCDPMICQHLLMIVRATGLTRRRVDASAS